MGDLFIPDGIVASKGRLHEKLGCRLNKMLQDGESLRPALNEIIISYKGVMISQLKRIKQYEAYAVHC
jgi:hypothetical protein